MGVNSLPKTATRQRCGCDLNPGPTAPESSTLTTRLPSHPDGRQQSIKCRCVTELAPAVTNSLACGQTAHRMSPLSALSNTVDAFHNHTHRHGHVCLYTAYTNSLQLLLVLPTIQPITTIMCTHSINRVLTNTNPPINHNYWAFVKNTKNLQLILSTVTKTSFNILQFLFEHYTSIIRSLEYYGPNTTSNSHKIFSGNQIQNSRLRIQCHDQRLTVTAWRPLLRPHSTSRTSCKLVGNPGCQLGFPTSLQVVRLVECSLYKAKTRWCGCKSNEFCLVDARQTYM